MGRFLEKNKVQLALLQALNNTNVTSKYFSMAQLRRASVLGLVFSMDATETFKIELLQAKDVDGTDAKGIPSTAGQLATKTVTANANVVKATITLDTFLAGGEVTINGVTFTAHANTTTEADREFAIDGSDTEDAAELVGLINDETYGVPGVTASSAAGVITLEADDGYDITITSDPDDATAVKATVAAVAAVDIEVESLDTENGFDHIAAKITTTANATAVAAVVVTGDDYYPVSQVIPHVLA